MEVSRPFQSAEAAKLYKFFRPHYPTEVYDTILNFYKEKNDSFSLALDIGCGTGLSTEPLAKYFSKVIGVDTSEAQLSKTDKSSPNVSYRKGLAEDLSFCESGSVDLVIVMMALHWIDREKFYREIQRVLKPNGVIAVCAYWAKYMDLGNKEATNILSNEFIEGVLMRDNFYEDASYLIPQLYEDPFTLPFRDFQRKTDLAIRKNLKLEEISGYFHSTHVFQNYLRSNPKATVWEQTINRIKMEIGYDDTNGDLVVPVTWPLCLLMARK